MSTFPGLIEEIPGLSVDRFDEDNLNSSVFFLSHCHRDHMIGLNNNFFYQIAKNHKFFYCSHISKSFLENTYFQLNSSFINKYLIELPLDDSKIIEYVHNGMQISFLITCISSGHCPGSLMFLFSFKDKRILYTGDFRINTKDISKLKSLHYNNATQLIPLHIEKMYLDTTFLNLDFQSFPSRLDSSKELCKTVKEWVEKGPKNIVILEISALYGSEFIYLELNKILNKKIHVKDHVYHVYSKMDILANCVTNDGTSTQIHACMQKMDSVRNVGLKCRQDIDQKNVLTIVPSVQKWAKRNTAKIIESDSVRKQTVNVCYSTHASYNELEAFIKYFNPKEIFPCVYNKNNEQEVYILLENIMKKKETSFKDNEFKFSKHKTYLHNSSFKSEIISDEEEDE